MATIYTTSCEDCGGGGAHLMITPCGGLSELCWTCLAYQEEQHAIDQGIEQAALAAHADEDDDEDFDLAA